MSDSCPPDACRPHCVSLRQYYSCLCHARRAQGHCPCQIGKVSIRTRVAPLCAGGEGPLAELHDARESLTAALTAYDAGLGLRHPIVRLLGCAQDPHSDQLLTLASSEGGLVGAFPVQYPANGSPLGSFTFGQPTYVLEGAHKEVGFSQQRY